MNQRFKTAVLMALVMIPILIFGDRFFIFDAFCLLLAIGAAIEFRTMLGKGHPLPKWLDILTVVFTAGLFSTILAITHYGFDALFLLIALIGVLLFYSIVLVFKDDFKGGDFANALLTIFHCSIGFAGFAYLRQQSLMIVLYLLLVVMATDTAAYFFGVRFGKHKIAPKVSPKKSVEGSIAGLTAGTLLGALFGFFTEIFGTGFHPMHYIMISAFLSVIGQIGDLVASKFKRGYEIKDYSNLFPGHGGILDRFDSSMFAAMHLLFILILIQVL